MKKFICKNCEDCNDCKYEEENLVVRWVVRDKSTGKAMDHHGLAAEDDCADLFESADAARTRADELDLESNWAYIDVIDVYTWTLE